MVRNKYNFVLIVNTYRSLHSEGRNISISINCMLGSVKKQQPSLWKIVTSHTFYRRHLRSRLSCSGCVMEQILVAYCCVQTHTKVWKQQCLTDCLCDSSSVSFLTKETYEAQLASSQATKSSRTHKIFSSYWIYIQSMPNTAACCLYMTRDQNILCATENQSKQL